MALKAEEDYRQTANDNQCRHQSHDQNEGCCTYESILVWVRSLLLLTGLTVTSVVLQDQKKIMSPGMVTAPVVLQLSMSICPHMKQQVIPTVLHVKWCDLETHAGCESAMNAKSPQK